MARYAASTMATVGFSAAGVENDPVSRLRKAIARGRGSGRWTRARPPHAHDVAHRDDPAQLAVLDDDEMTEAAPGHRVGGLLEVPLDVGEHGVGGQVLGHVLGVGILAL